MSRRQHAVARALQKWFADGHRDLPWRRTADPYRIWLSEIMLQQTRSQTVIPYYERFLERFPTLEALGAADEDEVLALWSGLGYYSRARNLRRAARQAVAAGGFPRDYRGLRELPGIGDYTAAAVASIAFRLPHAVVDGNVLRVISRVQNDPSDISSPRTRERFREIAQSWLDPTDPGGFNQALMELGATVCLPRNPLCLVCPLSGLCEARLAGTAGQLPVKLRQIVPQRVDATVLLIQRRDRILLRRRPQSEKKMAGFWELPSPQDLPDARAGARLGEVRHTITHHRYRIAVHAGHLPRKFSCPPGFQWFAGAERAGLPLSTIARKAFRLSAN